MTSIKETLYIGRDGGQQAADRKEMSFVDEEKEKISDSVIEEILSSTYALATGFAVYSAADCAGQAAAALVVRKNLGHKRVDALGALLKAKDALADREAFCLLGTDPETQLPYINGKNEAVREAQLAALTKTEREAVHAAEVDLARTEVKEDGAADDLDVKIGMLYVHAAHGFPQRKDTPASPKQEETPAPPTEMIPDSPVPER